jgi:hypothetical protein
LAFQTIAYIYSKANPLMNPLQETASLLRAGLQKQEREEKAHQRLQRQGLNKQVSEQFTKDFPQLCLLLAQSEIRIEGEADKQGQQLHIYSGDKALSIYFYGIKEGLSTWRFHGKEYQALSKEGEQRLIIDLAAAFELAQSKRRMGQ